MCDDREDRYTWRDHLRWRFGSFIDHGGRGIACWAITAACVKYLLA